MNEPKQIGQLSRYSKLWLVGMLIFLAGSLSSFAQTGTLVTSVEAESGVLYGGLTLSTAISGYSGTGYVTNFKNAIDSVRITVNVPKEAFYSLFIRYNSSGDKYQNINVNGAGASQVFFPQTSGWATADAGKYVLHAGDNIVTIENNWGWMDVDELLVYTATLNNYDNIVVNPVDPKANAATRSLYNLLRSEFGKKIISGQTDGYYNNIQSITGKSPMYRVSDFQHYTDGYSYKNGGFGWDDNKNTESMINWYNSTGKKGIVGFQWHWHSPSGGVVNTNTFYTQNTTFDVTKAVQKGTIEYMQTVRDIDSIATQLKKLQRANVPVLWRPLHEAGGGWFWWGAKGPDACKKLYAMMYDRLTNYHQIHNLIWVWSTYETDWYPGNGTVDIVGMDSYPGNYNYGTQKNTFDRYFNLTNGQKLITMSENGPIPDPNACLDFDAPWSYFMSWYDLVLSQNSNDHLISVYNNPRVLTLENDTIPMIITITNAAICGSEAVTLTATSNFGTVNWYDAPTGGNLIATGTSYTTPVLSLPATYYVEASYNGHPSELKRSPVTAIASSPIGASAISGTSVVCQGEQGVEYSLPADPNVVSYLWTLPAGATAANASTINSIWVNFGINAQSGNIVAKGSNACGDGPESTFAITVNALPIAPGAITGPTSVCANSGDHVYTVPEIQGVSTYTWTLPSGATGASTTNQISVNFSGISVPTGTLTVSGHNDCGDGPVSTLAVSINQLPANAGKISGPSSVCRNAGTVSFSVPSISGASSYIWTLPSGETLTKTSRTLQVNIDNTSVSGTIGVKGHNDCGDGAESTMNITINEVPETPAITFLNGVFQSNAPAGNQWYFNNSPISGAVNQTFTSSRVGDYYSIVSVTGCSTLPSNTISIFPTGINGASANPVIRIYPNPIEKGSSMLTISGINPAENNRIKIFDIKGELVFSGQINDQTIDLGKGFSAGIYLVKLISNGNNFTEKLIVK